MIELVNKKSNVNLATPTIVVKEGGSGDLSNYYTKSEVDALIPDVSGFALKSEIPSIEGLASEAYVDEKIAAIPEVDLSGYALKTEIPDVSGFITEIPAEYVTEDELNAKGYLTEHQSLDGYAKVTDIPDVSGYALKTEIPDVSRFITEIPTEYVTESELNAKDYATKAEIPDVSEFITQIPAEYVTDSELAAKGYLTEHQSLDGYAKITDIPDVSAYQTEAQVIALIQANMPASGDEVSY